MPKLRINDTEIEVPAGTSILQAAEMLGAEVPRFCYHDRLSVPANCRMCLVEVKGAPKAVASCAMACGDNMEVFTESAMVKKARKGVMEFLLINHPLDCPICDQGGECDLQDQAVAFGYDRSRYHETKRAVPDKDLGPLVKTTMTRCIQCTRCVRFADEIAGVPELGLLNRGEDVEIGTFVEKAINSELSGNLVDVCPVGALTSAQYAYQARPWELRKTESIDVHDAVGCNIRIDARGNEVLRVLPRLHEGINEEWLNDRSRYAVDGLSRVRLDKPYLRNVATNKMDAISWDEAILTLAARLNNTRPDAISALAGDLVDVEAVVALKDLMTSCGTQWLECRTDGAQFDPSQRAGYLFNSTIAGIDQAAAIVIVGCDLRREATLINARIRRAWRERGVPVAVVGVDTDLTYPVTHLGTNFNALDKLVSGKHDFAAKLQGAQRPMLIVGMQVFTGADGAAVHAYLYDVATKLNLVRDDWNGFNVVHNAAGRVGALEVGFTSAKPLPLDQMELVYLLGVDDADILAAISPSAFVVYQGHHGNAGARRADLVLPGAAYTEKDALYVNTEGRPQLAKRAAFPPGEAKEDWKIIRAVAGAAGKNVAYNTLSQLRQRIGQEWPHLLAIDTIAAAKWAKFGGKGKVNMDAALLSSVADFYNTNVITASSPTMAACSKQFGRPMNVAQVAE